MKVTCSALGQLVEGFDSKGKGLRNSVLKKQFVKRVTSVRPRPKSMVISSGINLEMISPAPSR